MRKLFIRSLSDLKNGLDFSSTWFKTLFQFGRLEGLPVKQDGAVFSLNTKISRTTADSGFSNYFGSFAPCLV